MKKLILLLAAAVLPVAAADLIVAGANGSTQLFAKPAGKITFKCDGTTTNCTYSNNIFTISATGTSNSTATFASAATSVVVTHNLGTTTIDPAMFSCDTGTTTRTPLAITTITSITTTQATLNFSAAPAAGRCRVNVSGIGPQGIQGNPGTAATIAVGTVTTGAAGSAASVTNVGTSSAAIFNIAIPQGAAGTTGPAGPAPSGTGVVKVTSGVASVIPNSGNGYCIKEDGTTGACGAGTTGADLTLSNLSNYATARTNLGLGTSATSNATDYLIKANSLGDLTSPSAARTNLGLGSAATQPSTAFAPATAGTGPLKANGTGGTSLAAAADIAGLFSGTGGYLKKDGTTGDPAGSTGPTLDLTQQSSSPSNPSAGHVTVFSKTDGNVYKRLPDGTEVQLATGSISGRFAVTTTSTSATIACPQCGVQKGNSPYSWLGYTGTFSVPAANNDSYTALFCLDGNTMSVAYTSGHTITSFSGVTMLPGQVTCPDGSITLYGVTVVNANVTGLTTLDPGYYQAKKYTFTDATIGGDGQSVIVNYNLTKKIGGPYSPGTGTSGVLVDADLTWTGFFINDANAKSMTEASCYSDTGSQNITVKVGSTTAFTMTCVAQGSYIADGLGTHGHIDAAHMTSNVIASNADLNQSGTANGTTHWVQLHVYAK